MGWLHDLDALTSLADWADGEIRDWALTRLALRAPDRVKALPSGAWDASIAVVAGAPIQPADLPALALLPAAIDAIGWGGRLPEDPTPWIEVLGPIARTERTPELIRLLADLGALDTELLGFLSASDDPVVPGLVLRWAAADGRPLDALAVQIAESVARKEVSLTQLADMGTVLGLPKLLILAEDAAEAVRIGSARAGNPLEPPVQSKGSARRRADRTVQALLEGRTDPAAAWLRAIAPLEGVPPDWVAGIAGWCAAYVPDADPVASVTARAGGEDRRLLAAARRALGPVHREAVATALAEPEIGVAPASALAADLVVRGLAPELGAELASHLQITRLAASLIGLTADPEAAADWVTESAVGLIFARYLPTEAVLARLLASEPDDPTIAVQRAWALAEMADPAGLDAVRAAVSTDPDDPELAEALAHGERLLGRAP